MSETVMYNGGAMANNGIWYNGDRYTVAAAIAVMTEEGVSPVVQNMIIAFAAMWQHEPTKRTQNRWVNTETGRIVYSPNQPGGGRGRKKAAGDDDGQSQDAPAKPQASQGQDQPGKKQPQQPQAAQTKKPQQPVVSEIADKKPQSTDKKQAAPAADNQAPAKPQTSQGQDTPSQKQAAAPTKRAQQQQDTPVQQSQAAQTKPQQPAVDPRIQKDLADAAKGKFRVGQAIMVDRSDGDREQWHIASKVGPDGMVKVVNPEGSTKKRLTLQEIKDMQVGDKTGLGEKYAIPSAQMNKMHSDLKNSSMTDDQVREQSKWIGVKGADKMPPDQLRHEHATALIQRALDAVPNDRKNQLDQNRADKQNAKAVGLSVDEYKFCREQASNFISRMSDDDVRKSAIRNGLKGADKMDSKSLRDAVVDAVLKSASASVETKAKMKKSYRDNN